MASITPQGNPRLDQFGANSNCSFGLGSPLAITVPYNMDFQDFFAVFYSFMPYTFGVMFLFYWVTTRHVLSIILLFLMGIGSLLNEVAFTKIVSQDRPIGSCLTTKGNPSGHALDVGCLLVFLVLETLLRNYWNIPKKIAVIFLGLVALVPILPARVRIYDHSWNEVGAGLAAGISWGLFVWLITHFIFKRYILEYWASWKITGKLCRNDVDPTYRFSKWKGQKAPKDVQQKKDRWNKRQAFFEIGVSIISFIMGIFGICAGAVWNNYNACPRNNNMVMAVGAGCISIACGIMLLARSLFIIFRKRQNMTIRGLVLTEEMLSYVVVLLYIEGLIFSVVWMTVASPPKLFCATGTPLWIGGKPIDLVFFYFAFKLTLELIFLFSWPIVYHTNYFGCFGSTENPASEVATSVPLPRFGQDPGLSESEDEERLKKVIANESGVPVSNPDTVPPDNTTPAAPGSDTTHHPTMYPAAPTATPDPTVPDTSANPDSSARAPNQTGNV